MKPSGSKHTRRNIVLVALLAVLCIGAAELAACRHFAPDVYQQITAPVRHAASVTVDACRVGLNAAGQFCQDVGEEMVRLAQQAGEGIVRFAHQATRQASQFWEELTTPKLIQLEYDEPPESSSPENWGPVIPPALTELLERDGRQILTGGNVDIVYFYQASEEWAGQPYGSDTIGPYGCGPTVMAMVVASMTDTDTDPAAMAAWAVQNGHWARRSGSYDSIVPGAAQAFGLEVESLPTQDPEDLRTALRDGKLLVAHIGPGHFTTGGHFILIHGATLTVDLLVADPNSPERSLMIWDPQIILDELSSARSHGAPLWVISKPR